MNNHRIFKVSFLPPTNTLGARVKIKEETDGINKTKVLDFEYEENNTLQVAAKYLKSIGINLTGCASTKDVYYIFSDSWNEGKGFINVDGTVS